MNTEQKLLVTLAASGLVLGLLTSITNPVLGFVISGVTVMLAILGTIVEVKKFVTKEKLVLNMPAGIDTSQVYTRAGIVIAAFIPLLIEEVMLLIGMLLFVLSLISLGLKDQIQESDLLRFSVVSLIALAFILAFIQPQLLLVPIGLAMVWFLISLLPLEWRRKMMEIEVMEDD